ncbi:MAG: hypothetical protein MZV64_30880 [Ignavibacteriales bacterium]|nr:hypothetical protein [Ignavibacteriales bacterium]
MTDITRRIRQGRRSGRGGPRHRRHRRGERPADARAAARQDRLQRPRFQPRRPGWRSRRPACTTSRSPRCCRFRL